MQDEDDTYEGILNIKKLKFNFPLQIKDSVSFYQTVILLMEEILHHLGCIKPYKQWDIYHINWCRISSISSSMQYFQLTLDNPPRIDSSL